MLRYEYFYWVELITPCCYWIFFFIDSMWNIQERTRREKRIWRVFSHYSMSVIDIFFRKSFVVVIVALLLRSSSIIICKASSASSHRAIVCSNSTTRVLLLLLLLILQRAESTRREREGRKQEGCCAGSVTSSLLPSFSVSVIRLRASYPESKSATTAPTPSGSVGL